MEKKNSYLKILLGLVSVLCMLTFAEMDVTAAEEFTIQDLYNTYPDLIEISPDGTAWTIPGVPGSAERLEEGYRIDTGIESTLPEPGIGEHEYPVDRAGKINVGYWRVEHNKSECIHGDDFVGSDFHGIIGGPICKKEYDNGWYAYCADCNKLIVNMLIYTRSDIVRNITVLPGKSDYYYLCPYSGSLEQGAGYTHSCSDISFNRYQVQYLKNMPEDAIVKGNMGNTFHMYNNEAIYEGGAATYTDTALRKNVYTCTGYKFIGWNTEPDGSGEWYSDGQEVLNLSTEEGVRVPLFAQWQPIETTLAIDANGGTYEDEDVFRITKKYKEQYFLLSSSVKAPEGYEITFEENGGSDCEDITTTKQFSHWQPIGAFGGTLKNNWYTFSSETDGHVDTVQIMYRDVPVTLPTPEQENISFAGWYYDAEFEDYCGQAGDEVSFTEDTTLYAKWVPLALYSFDNYEANDGKGAVNLRWEQKDNLDKLYRVYQFADTDLIKRLKDVSLKDVNDVLSAEDWVQIADAGSTAEAAAVNETFTYKEGGSTYEIQSTGYYQITASGGAGADYDEEHKGGKGATVRATYWLKKGDIITAYPGTAGNGAEGGVNGNGMDGGTAESYMGGGAGSEVYITRAGVTSLLLVAGGGGGATDVTNGGDGGADEFLRADGEQKGADGAAGGGGGYTGGLAAQRDVLSFAFDFDYDNCGRGVKEFVAPLDGIYKLEVWGSAGTYRNEADEDGDYSVVSAGQGGYATGTMELKKGDKLYVCVGTSSYNGGTGIYYARGGGATHIATTNRGELKNYESYKDEVLIVAGGGGGAFNYGGSDASGGDGGGDTGGTGLFWYNSITATGGTQTAGGTYSDSSNTWYVGSFGLGGNSNYAGGGGGWYGGAGSNGAGGGGSGYISSTLTNGSMESGINSGSGKARITINPQDE